MVEQILGRPVENGRESVYAQFFAQLFPSEQRILRTRTHKFVYNQSDIGELYDLENDPWEMHNLHGLPGSEELEKELFALMREHMVRLDDPILGSFDRIRHVY